MSNAGEYVLDKLTVEEIVAKMVAALADPEEPTEEEIIELEAKMGYFQEDEDD